MMPTECRTITREEAPSYLRLLCDVFELDYTRAQQIFFHEPFFDLDHKWGCFVDGTLRSILSTVPLLFGDGEAVGIAGVATSPSHRGMGLAQSLLEVTLERHPRALLFAHQDVVYRRVGFEVLDLAVRAPLMPANFDPDADLLPFDEVRERYASWAEAHPMRLRRDERRWSYWKWNLRMCSAVPGGYVCQEGDTIREAVFSSPPDAWPSSQTGHWYGLRSMASQLNLPLGEEYDPLMLMGRGFTDVPQMFMTDQF
jgi:GNAT superfamily N-acetyltransferase